MSLLAEKTAELFAEESAPWMSLDFDFFSLKGTDEDGWGHVGERFVPKVIAEEIIGSLTQLDVHPSRLLIAESPTYVHHVPASYWERVRADVEEALLHYVQSKQSASSRLGEGDPSLPHENPALRQSA